MIGTFAAVLFFTMLKEAYEDYQRYKSDNEINNRETLIINPDGSLHQTKWSDIKVGQIIKVVKDEQIPADILCINAPKKCKNIVYISTMNLDGETNLKEKVISFDIESVNEFQGSINCDLPNESLEQWDGNIRSKLLPKEINCSIKNVLLRGCTLKNTDYVFGIVLYVGNDTKIMQN